MITRQDLILATIRTAVPSAVGVFIAWLITRIPAISDVIVWLDAQIRLVVPDGTVTVVALLGALCVGIVTGVYYWLVRQLGKRWPIIERFLLGSSKQPIYTVHETPFVPGVGTRADRNGDGIADRYQQGEKS